MIRLGTQEGIQWSSKRWWRCDHMAALGGNTGKGGLEWANRGKVTELRDGLAAGGQGEELKSGSKFQSVDKLLP